MGRRHETGITRITLALIVGGIGVIIAGAIWLSRQPATSENTAGPTALVISEWGVKIPLTDEISDATYTIDNNGQAHVTTPTLASLIKQVKGCTSGLNSTYLGRNAAKPAKTIWPPIYINNYYYYPGAAPRATCQPQIKGTETGEKIFAINLALSAAIQQVTATDTASK